MGADTVTWIWFIGGLLLMLSELAMPGLVVVFMGAAAVLVAGIRALGALQDLAASVGAFMGLSVVLALGLRKAVLRYFPPEARRESEDELVGAYGRLVEVVASCDEDGDQGRIRFQGTSWPARMVAGHAEAGERVRLLYREDMVWVVEAPGEAAEQAEAAAELERELRGAGAEERR